jgi:hypothetical protein
VYLSELTENSPMYSSTGCEESTYYEAIRVNVLKSDHYSLRSNSSVDAFGYIYKENFNPFNLSETLPLQNDDNCDEGQFKLTANLQVGTTYILIVTTSSPNEIGTFLILASGPDIVTLNRISEYMYHLVNSQL